MVKFRPYFESRYPKRERWIAILALVNLLLVLFDLSYFNLRNVYLQMIPGLTRLYDPVKGVTPHPETARYLEQVSELEAQVAANGLQSPEADRSLSELRASSQELVTSNSFVVANQSNTFEAIQQELRSRTGQASSLAAWNQFWSQDYLEAAGWESEIGFWNEQVSPLIATHYYRRVNRFGSPISYFWLIDLPFMLIFAIDIGSRLWSVHRRFPQLSWFDIGLRRWFDLFLLLPFLRWLRVVPVTLRLYHSDILNLESARAELQRDAVISIAIELTEMIGIQLIEQMQASIQRKEFISELFNPEIPQPYGQIIHQREVNLITSRLFDVSVHRVLPRIRPDVEDLVHHSVDSAASQLPGYRQIQRIPGVRRLPLLISQRIANTLLHLAYNTLPNAVDDPVGAEMTSRLQRNLRRAFVEELQKQHYGQEIQITLFNVLERIKRNYVTTIAEIEGQQLIDRAEQLHQKAEQYRHTERVVD
ncbi:hypothetical protein [Egbenema bharatensis]|uniref:hypothetical protein n=1 Tax=Egbenema bharatensis TaxID=3463334 RepID=UPI003A8753F8